MTKQQSAAEQKHRTAKAQSTQHESGPMAAQQVHPIQQLQQTVGNAQIARMLAEDENSLWAQPEVGMAGGPVSNALASRIYSRLGGGQGLDSSVRPRMEANFGVDLEDVRVHDDAEANVLSLSVGASAFTLGNDIFFSELASPTDEGVLRHELTHVIQQQTMTTSGPLTVGPTDDHFEHEAEAVAASPTQAPRAAPATPTQTVQRGWLEDAYNFASNTAGSVGLGTSLIMESARGTQAAGVSPIADTLARGAGSGVQSLNNFLGPVGLATGLYGTYTGVDQMLNSATFGDRLTGGTDALFSALGAFSGGVGTAGMLGASTASLGPAAAVAGAGAGGYALGRLLDEGVGALGQAITGDEQGDYTISGGLASGMTAADQAISSLWADPDQPAYTQTLGWKLAEWLD
ncbi:MAG: DUF4157 domain-containing protein [Anaerolineae bacterium]|nr:DUF4157 domain-containing protein [Anaerolineae bacterium]